jgi:hypothetical protein
MIEGIHHIHIYPYILPVLAFKRASSHYSPTLHLSIYYSLISFDNTHLYLAAQHQPDMSHDPWNFFYSTYKYCHTVLCDLHSKDLIAHACKIWLFFCLVYSDACGKE